jgi:hypothetical protein
LACDVDGVWNLRGDIGVPGNFCTSEKDKKLA